jgi:hypothetical protein
MPVSAATGYPQYSDSAAGNFIPEVWSSTILVKFYEATCLAEICNTDYEGEIKNKGDKVIIRTTPDITIGDYEKGMTLSLQHPESPNKELEIDKAKWFAFAIDEIDKYQSDLNLLNDWADDAGQQMSIVIERDDVFANIYADAHASNKGNSAGAISGGISLGTTGTPVALTKADILDKIVDCRVVLDEQDVPRTDRWGIIPAWMAGMILKSDLKDASLAGDGTSILRNGRLGIIAGFVLYESNLLTTATDGSYTCYHSMFGQKKALSWASQFTKTEHIKPSLSFEEGIKGLNVYGYEVLKTEALIDLYIREGS